jgi:uncharacterized protein (TIGR02118 family)
MIKLTVLYGHPKQPDVFEEYYLNKHLPLAANMKGIEKVEYTKFLRGPDGTSPSHYRMAEFWVEGPEALATVMNSPEGMATSADLANFATGGVIFLVGEVE